MNGHKWTFLLVKDHRTPVRQFQLSPRTLHYGIGAAAGLLLTLSGLAVSVGADGAAQIEKSRLERENRLLTEELVEVRGRVESLEGDLASLAEKDAAYRVLAGLDTIDEEILGVGVGGPGTATPEEHPLWRLDPELGNSAFAISYDLKALERRARLLDESLDEATDSLKAHRELLERMPSILPTDGLLTSAYSRARFHPIRRRYMPHMGVDLAAPAGTPILAAARGTVASAGYEGGYGLSVEIDHGHGYMTRYGHSSRLLVREGQRVERGDVIALVGRTGLATSPHLHYEVRLNGEPQNPLNFVMDFR